MSLLFQPLKQGSVKNRVADAVRNAIYAGKLRPGDALLEMQLAKDFGVSQTSVREALIQLEQLGLVRRFPNKGTQVTELSAKELRERLEIRVQMECMAAVQAAPHLDPRTAEQLLKIADQIAAATSKNDYAGSAQADLQFHRTIWALSGNETLCQLLHQVSAPLFAFVSIMRSRRLDNLGTVLHSHQDIVDALRNGDPAGIRSTIASHLAGSYEQFLSSDRLNDERRPGAAAGNV